MKRLTLMLMLLCADACAFSGDASYYTKASCQMEGTSGVYTASGEHFDEQALTCAVRSHKFGSSYLVYGVKTRRTVVVRHNDFGPGRGPTRKGVVIDLTPRAFEEVCGGLGLGKCQVEVQKIGLDA